MLSVFILLATTFMLQASDAQKPTGAAPATKKSEICDIRFLSVEKRADLLKQRKEEYSKLYPTVLAAMEKALESNHGLHAVDHGFDLKVSTVNHSQDMNQLIFYTIQINELSNNWGINGYNVDWECQASWMRGLIKGQAQQNVTAQKKAKEKGPADDGKQST